MEIYSGGLQQWKENKLHSLNPTAGLLALLGLKESDSVVLHHCYLVASSSCLSNFSQLWQRGKGLALTTHTFMKLSK